MEDLRYKVLIECKDGPASIIGQAEFAGGQLHAVCEAPDGYLRGIFAELETDIKENDSIFVNGYQTWTYSPEFKPDDVQYIYGKKLPRALIDKFCLDRYGDLFFREYQQKPGIFTGFSYCWIRSGNTFRLFASLDETAGYTIFKVDANEKKLYIERDCRNMKCSGKLHAFDLFFAEGPEDEVFDAWFAAMGIKPRTPVKLAGYCSWYNRYDKIDEAGLLSDLEGASKILKEGDLFQIDDGWQTAVGDWLSVKTDKFPNGMKFLSDKIHERGFKAGLWLAPFGAQFESKLAKEHPDWLYDHGGKPWAAGINWGGFYAIDIDKPEVVSYIEEVFDTVLNRWGFDFVKLDFLYAAAPYGSDTESRAARMIRAMRFLRRVCGDKLILGCGVPLMPAFGLVDYCRIGCDVGPDWDDKPMMRWIHRERVSTKNSIVDTTCRRQLNGRAFMNDPDVFFLRDENCKLTDSQKEALYTANARYGGILLTSDDLNRWDDRKIALYKKIRMIFGA